MSFLKWVSMLSFVAISFSPIGLKTLSSQTTLPTNDFPVENHYSDAIRNSIKFDPEVIQSPSTPNKHNNPTSPSIYVDETKWSKMVFQRYNKNWDIMMTNGDGTDLKQLTGGSSYEICPEFNLGTTRIAYLSNQNGPAYDLWVMNADGSHQVDITNTASQEDRASWSPNSDWLAFPSNRSGTWQIYRIHPDGTQVTQLTKFAGANFSPTWSPDGSQIAWIHADPNSKFGAIWVMNADGSNPSMIVSNLTLLDDLHWSPDGRSMAFSYDDDHDSWLSSTIMSLNDNQIKTTKQGMANFDSVVDGFSPDGSMVVVTDIEYELYEGTYYIINTFTYLPISQQLTYGGFEMNYSWVGSDSIKPESELFPLPAFARDAGFSVYWQGHDEGPSGFSGFDVQYRVDNNPWTDWLQNTLSTSKYYVGSAGQTISFRERAKDNQKNIEDWTHDGMAPIIHIFSTLFSGSVYDNRGQPIPFPSLTLPNVSWEPSTVGANGKILKHLNQTGDIIVSAAHPGYSSLPPITLNANYDQEYSFFLPPTENILSNGSFDSDLNQWNVQGDQNWKINPDIRHSGAGSAQVGPDIINLKFGTAEQIVDRSLFAEIYSAKMKIDSLGNVHTWIYGYSYTDNGAYVYRVRYADGSWSDPIQFGNSKDKLYTFDIGPDGTIYAISGVSYSPAYLLTRPIGGEWSSPQLITQSTQRHMVSVAPDGTVNILYQDDSSQYWLIKRRPSGVMSIPIPIGLFDDNAPTIYSGPDDVVYVMNGRYVQTIINDKPIENRNFVPVSWDNYFPLVSPSGDLDILWLECKPVFSYPCDADKMHLYFTSISEAGVGSNIVDLGYMAAIFSAAMGPKGEIYLNGAQIVNDYYQTPFLLYRSPAGKWDGPVKINQTISANQGFSAMSVSSNGTLMTVINTSIQSNTNGQYLLQSAHEASASASEINQTISIPDSLHRPTLSFVYRLFDPAAENATGMRVYSTGDCSVEPYIVKGDTEGWQIGYLDMTNCANKTVTVHIALDQASGEPASTLLLDEVNLGSWRTPKLTGNTPTSLFDSSPEKTLTITGDNFDQPTVTVGGTTFSPILVNANAIDIDLSNWNPTPGYYDILVTNADGTAAAIPAGLKIGEILSLPLIRK